MSNKPLSLHMMFVLMLPLLVKTRLKKLHVGFFLVSFTRLLPLKLHFSLRNSITSSMTKTLGFLSQKSDWSGRHLRQNHAKRRRFQTVKSYSWVPLCSETAPLPLKKTTKKNAPSQRSDLSNSNFPINEREQSFRGVLARI